MVGKITDVSKLLCYKLSRPTRKEGAFVSVGCPSSQALSGHSRVMYTRLYLFVCLSLEIMLISSIPIHQHRDFVNLSPFLPVYPPASLTVRNQHPFP